MTPGRLKFATSRLQLFAREMPEVQRRPRRWTSGDRKSTRLNSSYDQISYAVFCLKKNNEYIRNLAVGVPLGYQSQDFQFSFGEMEVEQVFRMCNMFLNDSARWFFILVVLHLSHAL